MASVSKGPFRTGIRCHFSTDWQTKGFPISLLLSSVYHTSAHSSKQSCTQILEAMMHYIVWWEHLNIEMDAF